MRTETFYALVPDSKYLPDGHSTNHGCVEGFSRLVRILDQEIRVTDCKIYEILPPLLGHRHEFIVVAANVDGEEIQVIFQRTEKIKMRPEESTVIIYLGPIQDYFAERYGMGPSLPKYTWHLTWQGGDYPTLRHLAEIVERISNLIEASISMGSIRPHQCSLFSRSLLGVMATSFPGYVRGVPESVGLHRYLYSWFDYKPNHEVLRIMQTVLKELELPEILTWEQMKNLLAEF